MEITSKLVNDTLLATVEASRIDSAVTVQFKETMRQIASTKSARVVLDLSRVTFLDSSGLGAVVGVMKFLGPERKLEVAGLTTNVAKVFSLTRMDTVFRIHNSALDALAASEGTA